MNMYTVIKILVPLFLVKFQKVLDSLSSDYKQRQEDAAIIKMIDNGLTESKSKKLLEEIWKNMKKKNTQGNLIQIKD